MLVLAAFFGATDNYVQNAVSMQVCGLQPGCAMCNVDCTLCGLQPVEASMSDLGRSGVCWAVPCGRGVAPVPLPVNS